MVWRKCWILLFFLLPICLFAQDNNTIISQENNESVESSTNGVQDASGAPSSESKSRNLVIENAKEMFFGKVSSLDQDMLELKGNVILSVEEDGIKHKFIADLVRFNRDKGLIFISGNVQYEVSGDQIFQTFLADQIVFESDKLSGLIVGVWNKDSGEELNATDDVKFFYRSEHITKSVNGTITLRAVRVATSYMEDPYWSLRADMVWALQDDSWIVRHPLLYLGRVPVLYFPFYYHNDNIIFFNPVFGYSNFRGFTINTTTHLWGLPASSNLGIFNFNFGNNRDKKRNKVGHLSLMLDYYGREGFMSGFWGGFTWANIEYKAAVAFTKTLFEGNTVADPNGKIVWEHGYFFGRKTPVRYGFHLKGDIENLYFNLSLFSDPRFNRDFFTYRKTGADLFGFITLGSQGFNLVEEEISESYLRYRKNFKLNLTGLDEINIHYANTELILEPRLNAESVSPYASSQDFYALRTFNAFNTGIGLKTKIPFLASVKTEDKKLEKWQEWQWSFYYDTRFEERIFARRLNDRSNIPSLDWKGALTWQNLFSSRADVGLIFSWSDKLEIKSAVLNDSAHHRFIDDGNLTDLQKQQSELQTFTRLGSTWNIKLTPFNRNTYWGKSRVDYQGRLDFFENSYKRETLQRENSWKNQFRVHRLDATLRYDTGLYWAYTKAKGEQVFSSTVNHGKVTGEVSAGAGVDWYDWITETYVYTNEKDLQRNIRYGWGIKSSYEPWNFLTFYGDFRVDFKTKLDYGELAIRLSGIKAGFIWEEREIQEWDRKSFSWRPIINAQNGRPEVQFKPSYFYLKVDQPVFLSNNYDWMKKNFTRWDLSFVGEMRIDFVEYTHSKLEAGLRLDWHIAKQFVLSLKTMSYNTAMYTYFGFMRDALSIQGNFSFWRDLGYSFAFGNSDLRRLSPFKIGLVQLNLEWNLPDWTLNITYRGNPGQFYDSNRNWVTGWRQRFELVVRWRPLPAISHGSRLDEQGRWSNFTE